MKLLPFLMTLGMFVSLRAETTPLNQELVEGTENPIVCELAKAPSPKESPVFSNQKDANTSVGTYHYRLILPTRYHADPKKSWPCLFVMSPNGRAEMRAMSDYLKANGYIVVLLDEAKNGVWGAIVGNFLAAHDDVIVRTRVQEEKKYATGHSGGARASSIFVQSRTGFCGVVLQSAGAYSNQGVYQVSDLKRLPIRIAMIMGKGNPNHVEIEGMKKVFTTHACEYSSSTAVTFGRQQRCLLKR
jgi:poly(3-hydroxybutyrate) depolymerase